MAPVLVAVDEDPDVLGEVESQLVRRYAGDYQIVCVRDPGHALQKLTELSDARADVALVLAGLSLEDGAATLTAFTAAGIARACEHFPEQPRLWVISGGGRRNKTLMAMIAERVGAAVAPAEAAGMDGDAMEAEAWAYLAVRSLKGLPITFPGTTGVPRPLTGGVRAVRG